MLMQVVLSISVKQLNVVTTYADFSPNADDSVDVQEFAFPFSKNALLLWIRKQQCHAVAIILKRTERQLIKMH